MLEKVNLGLKLPRKEYKELLPGWQRRLYDLEKACWDHKAASVLVFEGWDAAGKGSAISTLTARLDPRGFRLYPIQAPRTYESNRPWLWRFWLRTPNYGEMAIFDRSWYRRVLDERVNREIRARDVRNAFRDIAEFERMLADDGTVIVKFWLHISKKEQKQRFRRIEKDPLESWHLTEEDWKRHHDYEKYLDAAEEMLEMTESEYGPWTIVEATSRWHAQKRIFETVIQALEARLGDAAPPYPRQKPDGKDADLRAAMDTAETAAGIES